VLQQLQVLLTFFDSLLSVHYPITSIAVSSSMKSNHHCLVPPQFSLKLRDSKTILITWDQFLWDQ
jgi:hypothetical protein